MHVADGASELVASCVERAREAAESRSLLRVPFETLFQYLQVQGACWSPHVAITRRGPCHAGQPLLRGLCSSQGFPNRCCANRPRLLWRCVTC